MNNLQIFNSAEFGEIRTVTIDGEPLFCLGDLCKALELTAKEVNRRLSDEVVSKHLIEDSKGRIQNTLFVNEDGLYDVILESRKENARKFRKWVTSDVLPSIRKTGQYAYPQNASGQIHLLAQGYVELEKEVKDVKADLKNFKEDMPLLAVECDSVTKSAKAKGVEVMGGKSSEAYRSNSLRNKVYRDIYGEIHRQFGVGNYKAIRRNQIDKALEIIANYEPPMALAEEIAETNAQLRF